MMLSNKANNIIYCFKVKPDFRSPNIFQAELFKLGLALNSCNGLNLCVFGKGFAKFTASMQLLLHSDS